MDFSRDWQFFIDNYAFMGALILICAAVAFVLTPWTGALARKFGVLDLPSRLRQRDDMTRERRIHTQAMPNLGGLAVVAALAVGLGVMLSQDKLELTPLVWALIAGGIVITIAGFLDSVFDLPAKTQFLFQILAAAIIVLSGIKILGIDILGLSLDFSTISIPVNLGFTQLTLHPIADLITIAWIVFVINAINWVSGIDALAGSLGVAAAITFMFIGVKYEAVVAAIISAALAGSVLGFLPFNLPPARTFNGSIGDMIQGYLLAVLAIISGAKLTATFILLALPVIDAIWVLYFRYKNNRAEIHSPLDILRISDKSHLHHRLLNLGFSVKQTLALEFVVFIIFCIAAYYFAGFSNEAIAALIAIALCLVAFVVISVLSKRNRKLKQEPETPAPDISETPEEKYAY